MNRPAAFGVRSRTILDPVHGLIRLTKEEMTVVDRPVFQRLRSIRQNGLLHLVFPAATHTRFEHSLGVLFVAHGVLNSLANNSQAALTKKNVLPLEQSQPNAAVEFPRLGLPERDFLYRVVRLAALVHDLGHGPLSHTFDSFAPRRESLLRVLNDPRLQSVGSMAKAFEAKCDRGRVPHEVVSCLFFAGLWHDMDREADVARAVVATVLGSEFLSTDDGELAHRWVPLAHDVIASAPADADRMDYMERDSRSIGVSYGLFDRNRVLKSFLCYREDRGSDPTFRLGIKQSGLQAIENLMQARYELFAQVYYHKTNRAVGLMLERIGEIAAAEYDLFGDTHSLSDWERVYLWHTDEHFIDLLLGRGGNGRPVPDEIRELTDDILSRRLWKRILEPARKEDVLAVQEELRAAFPDCADSIRSDEKTKPKALKDLSTGAKILIRNGELLYVVGQQQPWTERSDVIKALEIADSRFVRLYYAGTDTAVASEIRKKALEISYAFNEGSHATPRN